MNHHRDTAVKMALTAALAYGLILVMLFLLQRAMIYPGTSRDIRGWGAPPPGYEVVVLETSDGLSLNALYRASDGGKTLVFFHGNADSAHNSAALLDPALGEGDGALFVSYRGFAGNPGAPSEDGLYSDGEAALGFVRARGIADSDIVVGGFSLGTGVASHVATRGRFAGLLLVSSFTSLPAVAAAHFPWLPARWLVRDRYPTIERIADGKEPLLLVHGSQDDIISPRHSEALALRRPDAQLELVAGVGHNDVAARAVPIIADWLAALD